MEGSVHPGPSKSSNTDEDFYVFPASFAQQRLWFLHQLTPDSPAYSIIAALRVRGELDEAILERSLIDLVERHESLRTTFAGSGGDVVQVIAATGGVGLERVDLSGAGSAAQAEAEAEAWLEAAARRPFDLARGPLFRAAVLRLDAATHILAVSMHHIVSDGWSLGVLMRELSELYAAHAAGRAAALAELEIQYADYSLWQREWLQGAVLDAQVDYWREALAGAPTVLELPVDHPRAAQASQRGAQHAVRLDPALAERLRGFARGEGATLYMVLLAGFQALLSRYSGQRQLLVGSPIAGRTRRETEGLIGFFVNTLVLRGDLAGEPGLSELLARVRETTLGAYAHQDVPFEKLVEVLSPERDLSRSPLFQVMFILQNAPAATLALGEARLEPLTLDSGTAKFELTLALEEQDDGAIAGYWEYNRDLFEPATVARLAEHYANLLERALDNPHQPLARIDFLTPSERHMLLARWNDTQAPYPQQTIHQLFQNQVQTRPDAIALIDATSAMTYRVLNARANQLARYLCKRGAGPDRRVALMIEPTCNLIVAVLAVLKSGAAYVPIDPASPIKRANDIIDRSAAVLTLVESNFLEPASIHNSCEFGAAEQSAISEADSDLPNSVSPVELAYVIFTSGSTGRPKGVAVEHRQVTSYVAAVAERFQLGSGMRYSLLQPLAVDSCNTVLMPWLCVGGVLHVLPRIAALDADSISEHFRNSPADVLKIAPSHLAELLNGSNGNEFLPKFALVLGGEASGWDWLRSAVLPRMATGSNVHIHYGPTETTVGVLTHRIQAKDSRDAAIAPLGMPLSNAQVHIVDRNMEILPIGVVGEILIGGNCVARGYLNQPALTADRFCPDPFASKLGARAYRTGDLGRRLADGTIAFLGRVDNQVKMRGYRVELGEVEAALLEHPQIDRAIVLGRNTSTGDRVLAAYFVTDRSSSPAVTSEILRAWLEARLPNYMVPQFFMQIDSVPMAAQGKVDIQALPPLHSQEIHEDSDISMSDLELDLAEIWKEILNINSVNRSDDFFKLGGHSLLVMRMLSQVRKRLQCQASTANFLSQPTVSRLAQIIEDSGTRNEGMLETLQPNGSATPLVCIHPVGGEILCYVELARAMNEVRPVHAFRAAESIGKCSVEEIASAYVAELLLMLPDADCCLAGWSFGGLVAFEMARQLAARGTPVRRLVLFDTHTPDRDRTDFSQEEVLDRFAADLAGTLGLENDLLSSTFAKSDMTAKRGLLVETLFGAGLIDKATEPALDALLRMFGQRMMQIADYNPQRIGQDVELFAAAEGTGAARLQDQWKDWTTGRLTVTEVAGDHYTMLQPPNVAGLARLIEAGFAAAEQGSDKA